MTMTHIRGRQLLVVVSLAATAAVLASCGFPVAGGLIAGALLLLTLVVGGLSLLTTASCDSRAAPTDTRVGPCLKIAPDRGLDVKVGPCLSMPAPDRGPDVKVGPCLGMPAPDRGPDVKVGPCLKIAPDKGPDGKVGPCLSPPIKDAQSRLEDRAPGRAAVLDELRATGALTPEQAARIKRLPG